MTSLSLPLLQVRPRCDEDGGSDSPCVWLRLRPERHRRLPREPHAQERPGPADATRPLPVLLQHQGRLLGGHDGVHGHRNRRGSGRRRRGEPEGLCTQPRYAYPPSPPFIAFFFFQVTSRRLGYACSPNRSCRNLKLPALTPCGLLFQMQNSVSFNAN